jgi:hypothetical protein
MMEAYSFITFIGGILVGIGLGALVIALVMVIWGRNGG